MNAMQAKVQKGVSVFKRLVIWMGLWGLVFSLATIGRLRVAFDYDDTLVFSTPAFKKAFDSGAAPFSDQFWRVVNQSYDLEKPKLMMNAVAWIFRACGFRITVLTSRPAIAADALKKEWRRLASQFQFTGSRSTKHKFLSQGNYVLFFGDSDSDITEGRLAGVFSLRVRRSPKSSYKEDYSPGTLNEFVIPFSEH